MNQNAIYVCIFQYNKICSFLARNADVTKTQGVFQVIHKLFGSSIGNV